MKAEKVKKIEGCLEGTNVKDILLSDEIDKEFIDYLAELGRLIYHQGSGKPFFKVIVRTKYSIKGVLSGKSFRVVLPSEAGDEYISELLEHIEKYNPNIS